jgi:hypothetical protein
MQWSDIPFNPSRKVLRQFAALGLVVFLALGAREVFFTSQLLLGSALGIVAILIGLAGLFRPALLRRIFIAWMVVAFPIGWLISQLILVVLYFLVLTPVAWILRLRGRDLLGRTPTLERESYWEPKQSPLDPRSYFRQY